MAASAVRADDPPVVGKLVGVAQVGDAVGEVLGLAVGPHECPVGSCWE